MRLSSVSRFVCFLFGFSLLLTISPHSDPWRLVHVARIYNVPAGVAISFVPTSLTVTISEVEFVAMSAVSLFLVLVLILWERPFFFREIKKTTVVVSSILAVEFLVFTLVPVSYDLVHDAKSVVIYLVLGTISFAYLAYGAAPLLHQILLRLEGSGTIDDLWESIKSRFLSFHLPVFLVSLVTLNFLFTNLASYFLFGHIPHIDDSIAQVFHAKIFSLGYLSVPSPSHPEFFECNHVINNGQWYSQYPPGHIALLAAGVLIGAPWIINPLFGSLTIIPLYFLGRELYGEVVGRTSAVLALLSPFLVFMSSEFMSHTTTLFFFLVFLLFFVKMLKSGKGIHGLIAGAAFGWMITIRPYTAAAISLPFLLYGALAAFRDVRRLKVPLLTFSTSLAFFLCLLFTVNTLTNGHPFLFGYDVLWGVNGRPGFGQSGWGPVHTPFRGLLQTMSNLNALNKYLFEWPVPSLLFVIVLFMSHTKNTWDYLFLSSFLALVVAYFFYWFQDWCFGPRFFFESAGLLIILTARGLQVLPDLLRDLNVSSASSSNVRLLSLFTAAFFFGVGHFTNVPAHIKNYSNNYWRVSTHSLEMVKQAGISRGVIFTRREFGEVFPANSPLLDGDLIFVRDKGLANRKIMERFPGYDSFLVTKEQLVRLEAR